MELCGKKTTGSSRYTSSVMKHGYCIIQRCIGARLLKNSETLIKRCLQGKQEIDKQYANYLYENLSGMKEFWDIKASKKIVNSVAELHGCDAQVHPKFICFTSGIIFEGGNVVDLNPVPDKQAQAVHAIISGLYGLRISISANKSGKRKIIHISPASAFIYRYNLDVQVESFLNKDEKESTLGMFYIPVSYILYHHVSDNMLMVNVDRFMESVSTDFVGNAIPSDSTEKLPETVVMDNFHQIANEKNADNFFHLLGCSQKIVDELKALETDKSNLKHNLSDVLKSNIQTMRNDHVLLHNTINVEYSDDHCHSTPKKIKLMQRDLYLSEDDVSSNSSVSDVTVDRKHSGLGLYGGKDITIMADIFNNESEIADNLTATTKALQDALQTYISCTNDWKKDIRGILMVKSKTNETLQEDNIVMKKQLEQARANIFQLEQTNEESISNRNELAKLHQQLKDSKSTCFTMEQIIEQLKIELKQKDTILSNLKNIIQGLL